jgi:hypothetical protein
MSKPLKRCVWRGARGGNPPLSATQLQSLGGVSAVVIGAFCEHEHNDQVSTASWTSSPPRLDLGLGRRLALIRLRMAGGGAGK